MEPREFDYFLAKERISQKAVFPKDSSRLMIVTNKTIEHKHFYDIINYLKKDDVLVINETKVSKAKIVGKKTSGSKAEIIICERIGEDSFKARIKGNKVRVGNKYIFGNNLECSVVNQEEDIFTIRFNRKIDEKIIEQMFELPLPPYVKRKIENESEYQTVYSEKDGSLAAPTAGLHFTKELLDKIKKKGVKIAKVCLHIDFGTFLPVKGKVEEHKMHAERFEISKEAAELINNRKGRLIAVGTTSVRTLESAADNEGKVVPSEGVTSIFIYPGYKFKNNIDAMITNFHLPKSTLIMLVCAYFGKERVMEAYSEAIKKKYRFYSLGDAMMLVKEG